MARHLASISAQIGRQVGVLLDRRGRVTATFVGDAHRIYLPDVGRARVGGGHFRGVRHIHTVLDDGTDLLGQEDLADLKKLRLDSVCTIAVNEDGTPGHLSFAHLLPGKEGERHRIESRPNVHHIDLDFLAHIRALEQEWAKYATRLKADGREPALIVGVYRDRATSVWRMAEIKELAATAGVQVADTMVQLRQQADHRYVVGRGKLEEVVLRALDLDAELIIFDHDLSPAQARAIASFSDLRVIDRTQLILDIFAQHASSRDGKLQVELAQLKYNLPRLTDLDAGLSRLTGGIGGRGPGETKLEINRRRARDRIARLDRDIAQLHKRRALLRSRRERNAVPTISIVGYTNAGKSTLLNALTRSDVLVADQLFATLDPSSRRLRFPREQEAIITDTVGFIRDLPNELLAAFKATLEELESADLLLHVVDGSDPMAREKRDTVRAVLQDLHLGNIPEIVVYNKIDLVEDGVDAAALRRTDDGLCVSAITRQGLQELVSHIGSILWPQVRAESPKDPTSDAKEDIEHHAPTESVGVHAEEPISLVE